MTKPQAFRLAEAIFFISNQQKTKELLILQTSNITLENINKMNFNSYIRCARKKYEVRDEKPIAPV